MKFFKRLILILFSIAVAVCGVGCKVEPLPTAEDFSLEISVDKTTLSVGETITITATFKNLIGRDVYIEFDDDLCVRLGLNREDVELKDLLVCALVPVDGGIDDYDVIVEDRYRVVIPKEAQITVQREILATEAGLHEVFAFASFSSGDKNSSQRYNNEIQVFSQSVLVESIGEV